MKKLVLATTVLFGLALGASTSASAADSCGYFAFAGAFKSFAAANRQANRVGGAAWGLDSSNSPNAGKGLWVVALGPGSRSQANRWRNQYKARGVRSAYVANRCFFGE